MLCFDEEVAREIGVTSAVVLHQIQYWLSKGFGREIKGRVYIYNTYEQWQKQLSFVSVRTLKRVFKQLVKEEIVFTYRKGYDRTSYWSLNYSHPIVTKWHYGKCQSGTMESDKVALSVHTLTTRTNKQDIRQVGLSDKQTTSRPTVQTRSYREDFKEANEWLEENTSEFQDQVRQYLEYHCNSPNVSYPHALRMKIIVEIWKKYNGKSNHTDFTYIDKEGLKPSETKEFEVKKKTFTGGLEEEMEQLYLRGEV